MCWNDALPLEVDGLASSQGVGLGRFAAGSSIRGISTPESQEVRF